jgi:hypothetical protein
LSDRSVYPVAGAEPSAFPTTHHLSMP